MTATWVRLDSFDFPSGPRRARPFRAVIVRICDRALGPAALDAWVCNRGEVLSRAIRVDLANVKDLPDDVEVLAIYRRPEWRSTFVVVSHSSFAPVKDGDRLPDWPHVLEELEESKERKRIE